MSLLQRSNPIRNLDDSIGDVAHEDCEQSGAMSSATPNHESRRPLTCEDLEEGHAHRGAMEEGRGRGQARGGGRVSQDEARFERIRGLLFADGYEEQLQDNDNWNERFQAALELGEETVDDQYHKWQSLTGVNRDFVAAAVTYGKTIISEYFLDCKFKSLKPQVLGGIAGGKKFMWRGILFKLADGSTEPYFGNDEAAAKGAGHDLRGATHYLGTRIRGLHFALQCVIDFKGFRMTAQAKLPVDASTLKYGTSDGARTVHNEDERLASKLRQAGVSLNVRPHKVKDKILYSACDIEGHLGHDKRFYLLDFARSFPPESPFKVGHLSDLLNNGTAVHVDVRSGTDDVALMRKRRKGVILKAEIPLDTDELVKEDIMYEVQLDTGEVIKVPASGVRDRQLSIYWRMMRPEFVKGCAQIMANQVQGAGEDTPQAPQPAPPPTADGSDGLNSGTTASGVGRTSGGVGSRGGGIRGGWSMNSFGRADQILWGRRNVGTGLHLNTHISEATEDTESSAVASNAGGGFHAASFRALASARNDDEDDVENEAKGQEKEGREEGAQEDGQGQVAEGVYTNMSDDSDDDMGADVPLNDAQAQERLPEPVGRRERNDGGEQATGDEGSETGRAGQNASRARENPPGGVSNGHIGNGDPGGSHASGAVENGLVSLDDSRGLANRHVRPSLTPAEGRRRNMSSPTGAVDQTSIGDAERGGASHHGSSDGGRELNTGDAHDEYDVYMDYNLLTGTERGAYSGSSGGSSRHSARIAWGSYSRTSPVGSMYLAGSGSYPTRQGGSASRYDVMDPSESFRRGGYGVDVNVGGGAGGASGRAGPRVIVLDGSSSGNASYRFYPTSSDDIGDDDELDAPGQADPATLRHSMMQEGRRREAARTQQPVHEGQREEAEETENWGCVPLSPDALSRFSKYDEERATRNQEVHEATSVMIDMVVPMVAERLVGMPPKVQETLDLAIELHRHGVNIRHLGKVRSLISDTEPNSLLRDMTLTEMVARTLKNILRSYQRLWMKTRRSTSEQGMRQLVIEFLNVLTGAHVNSKVFWEEEVTVGVLQRFGVGALTKWERQNLLLVCASQRKNVLKTCVFKLTEMQGLVLSSVVEKQFEMDEDPASFEFVVADIQEIRPIVRYMHILDYGGGVMLSMQARTLQQGGQADPRVMDRLNFQAKQYFITAYQSLPDDKNTRNHLMAYSDSLSFTGAIVAEDRPLTRHDVAGSFGTLDDSRGVVQLSNGDMIVSGRNRSTAHRVNKQGGFLRRFFENFGGLCSMRTCVPCNATHPLDYPVMQSTYSGTNTSAGTRRPSDSEGANGAQDSSSDLGPPPKFAPGDM